MASDLLEQPTGRAPVPRANDARPVLRHDDHGTRQARSASEVACKPSSVPLARGWSSIWDAGRPTPPAADPKAGRRTPVQLAPHAPSYLALHQVELARFTRSAGAEPTRLCGAGPRLAADGCYPLPCVVVLGLSSSDESPRHPRPSGHLAGRRTLPPTAARGRRRWGPAARPASHLDGPVLGFAASVHQMNDGATPVRATNGTCKDGFRLVAIVHPPSSRATRSRPATTPAAWSR
jgi:hypothetical protein